MSEYKSNPLLLALAVIGGIALALLLGSWVFHASMMSGGMMGGMMGGMAGGAWLLGLLFLAAIAAAIIVLFARRRA